jgi:hypothetical protein
MGFSLKRALAGAVAGAAKQSVVVLDRMIEEETKAREHAMLQAEALAKEEREAARRLAEMKTQDELALNRAKSVADYEIAVKSKQAESERIRLATDQAASRKEVEAKGLKLNTPEGQQAFGEAMGNRGYSSKDWEDRALNYFKENNDLKAAQIKADADKVTARSNHALADATRQSEAERKQLESLDKYIDSVAGNYLVEDPNDMEKSITSPMARAAFSNVADAVLAKGGSANDARAAVRRLMVAGEKAASNELYADYEPDQRLFAISQHAIGEEYAPPAPKRKEAPKETSWFSGFFGKKAPDVGPTATGTITKRPQSR